MLWLELIHLSEKGPRHTMEAVNSSDVNSCKTNRHRQDMIFSYFFYKKMNNHDESDPVKL